MRGLQVKKKITVLFFFYLLLLTLTDCPRQLNSIQLDYPPNEIIHLPYIPIEIKYNGLTYIVQTDKNQIDNIEEEIGVTEDIRFRTFSLKHNDEKKAIAILIREKPTIYYRAIIKYIL